MSVCLFTGFIGKYGLLFSPPSHSQPKYQMLLAMRMVYIRHSTIEQFNVD